VVISTANTALYVASRTLYGLTMSNSFEKQHPILAKLSRTTPPAEKDGKRAPWWAPWRYVGGNVPLWAVPASAIALCFVPLLHLKGGNSIQTVSLYLFLRVTITNVRQLQHITSQTASVGCLLVWASQCWAFIRYYYWLVEFESPVRPKFKLYMKLTSNISTKG
jgi:amino acid transporter